MRVYLRAGKIAVKAAVEMAGWLVMNWGDKMVGQVAVCWDKRMVVTRVCVCVLTSGAGRRALMTWS